jgi:hypothetical protein
LRAFRGRVGSGFAAYRKRRATWFVDPDGMWVLSARLPAEEGELVAAALRAATDFPDDDKYRCAEAGDPKAGDPGAGATDVGAGSGAGETIDEGVADTEAQAAQILGVEPEHLVAADALVELARRALAASDRDTSGEDRHLVVLHLDAAVAGAAPDETPVPDAAAKTGDAGNAGPGRSPGTQPATDHVGGWAGRSARAADAWIDAAVAACRPGGSGPLGGGRCHLQHGAGLDPVTALRMCCEAEVIAVLHQHFGDGLDLRLGRSTRKIPAKLRRAVGLRDGGCRWPGCHRQTHLQIHHVIHWAHGGPTDPPNLVSLCRTHHMLVHEGGYTIGWDRGVPGSSWIVRDPSGRVVPAVRTPDHGPHHNSDEPCPEPNPGALRSGWSGEPFHLADTCGALLDNTLPAHHEATPAPDKPEPMDAVSEHSTDDHTWFRDTEAEDFYRCLRLGHTDSAEDNPWPITAPIPEPDVVAAERIATTTTPVEPYHDWIDDLDLDNVSNEELIDGSYWRKVWDEHNAQTEARLRTEALATTGQPAH